jgi:micrococcal nuclease
VSDPVPLFTYAATVRRVVDADTLDVDLDLGMRVHLHARLRVAGVDAPESWTDEGKAAAAYVRSVMHPGDPLVVTTQKPDKYGRILAAVSFSGGCDLAEVLLELGHARPYDGGSR